MNEDYDPYDIPDREEAQIQIHMLNLKNSSKEDGRWT